MRDHSSMALFQKSVCLLVLASAFLSASFAHAQKSEPTLEERLSSSQFKAFGLEKLTPEELKGLNEWLHGKGALATSRTGDNADDRNPKYGFIANETDREAVSANLVGVFTGWSGSTTFKLDNGQEWKQVESASLSIAPRENAAVTIKPKTMGSWLLVVEDCGGCRVSVRRTK